MKNLLNRLLSGLNISGRDGVVLTLSLLLAFSVWMIHNLSLKYNANLKAEVVAVSNLDGYEDVSVSSAEVTARARTTGYKIIASYAKSKRPVRVEFPQTVMQYYSDDRFYITGDRLTEYSHVIFGEDVSVEHYVTDTLFFRFPKINSRKVPVVPVSLLTFRSQYMSRGPLKVEPDSVVVEGEPHLLENIERVYTAPIRYFDVSENISGVIPVEPLRGVDMQLKEAYYSMDVTRYVEIVEKLPVSVKNVPIDRTLLVFPSTVEVRFKCEFPLTDFDGAQIKASVDYNEFKSSLKGNCIVNVTGLPKGVITYEVEPVSVRCVEEGR